MTSKFVLLSGRWRLLTANRDEDVDGAIDKGMFQLIVKFAKANGTSLDPCWGDLQTALGTEFKEKFCDPFLQYVAGQEKGKAKSLKDLVTLFIATKGNTKSLNENLEQLDSMCAACGIKPEHAAIFKAIVEVRSFKESIAKDTKGVIKYT